MKLVLKIAAGVTLSKGAKVLDPQVTCAEYGIVSVSDSNF
jgi:hypothetical protein